MKQELSVLNVLRDEIEDIHQKTDEATDRAKSASSKYRIAINKISDLEKVIGDFENKQKAYNAKFETQMMKLLKNTTSEFETLLKKEVDELKTSTQTEMQKYSETIINIVTRIDQRQQQEQHQQQELQEQQQQQQEQQDYPRGNDSREELSEIKELLKENIQYQKETRKEIDSLSKMVSERLDKIDKRLSKTNPVLRRSSLGSERSLPSVDESILGLVGQQIGTTRQIQIRQRPQSSTGRQRGPLGASNNTQSTIAMRRHSFDNNS